MDIPRLKGLDDIRGLGILAVVFLHSATFHYEGITAIDMDDPPVTITIIGFLLMWAGLFAILSGAAYAYTTVRRLGATSHTPGDRSAFTAATSTAQWITCLRSYLIAGGVALALHYIYFIVLAPKLLDLEHGAHQYALLPGLIAAWGVPGRPWLPPFYGERLFYSTTLSMIGWNLILTGPLLALLARRGQLGRGRRDVLLTGGLGALIMLVSLARIPLYPLAERAIEQNRVPAAVFYGFLVNKNNPILPYLAFGLFGTSLGLALAGTRRPRRVLIGFSLLGAVWLAAGLIGLFTLPSTMLEREIDLFWYFLMFLQLGLFLLLVVVVLAVDDLGRIPWLDRLLRPVRRLGTVSLSIFMLETIVSQVLVRAGDALFGEWRLQIGPCLAFGAFNVLLWAGLIALWARTGFRYSLEWLTVQLYRRLGRPSDKAAAQTRAA